LLAERNKPFSIHRGFKQANISIVSNTKIIVVSYQLASYRYCHEGKNGERSGGSIRHVGSTCGLEGRLFVIGHSRAPKIQKEGCQPNDYSSARAEEQSFAVL